MSWLVQTSGHLQPRDNFIQPMEYSGAGRYPIIPYPSFHTAPCSAPYHGILRLRMTLVRELSGFECSLQWNHLRKPWQGPFYFRGFPGNAAVSLARTIPCLVIFWNHLRKLWQGPFHFPGFPGKEHSKNADSLETSMLSLKIPQAWNTPGQGILGLGRLFFC